MRALIISHQDPDVVGSLNVWLQASPNAVVVLPKIWSRFIPHMLIEEPISMRPIPDEGDTLRLPSGSELVLTPAHFLHSPGNMAVYDPATAILFTGDVGAAPGVVTAENLFVEDFSEVKGALAAFHRRYMASGKALRAFVDRVRSLDLAMVCPQHGPIYRGDDIGRLFDWLYEADVGVDLW